MGVVVAKYSIEKNHPILIALARRYFVFIGLGAL